MLTDISLTHAQQIYYGNSDLNQEWNQDSNQGREELSQKPGMTHGSSFPPQIKNYMNLDSHPGNTVKESKMFWGGNAVEFLNKIITTVGNCLPWLYYRPSYVENAIKKKKKLGKKGGRKVIRSIATKKRTHFHCSLRQVDVLRYFLYSHQAKN